MSTIVYNKLVRDRIPTIIEGKGEHPVVRTLTAEEYKTALLEKLVEEAKELLESQGSLNERADVAEVLAAIDTTFVMSAENIEIARQIKVQDRGGFTKKLYLEEVTVD